MSLVVFDGYIVHSEREFDGDPLHPGFPTAPDLGNEWRLYLANSTNPAVNIYDLSAATGVSISIGLNKPGTVKLSIPLTSDAAYLVEPITTCLVLYHNRVAVWSGPVWTLEETAETDTLSINAIGWYEILNHRYLRDTARVGGAQTWSLPNPTAASSNTTGWSLSVGTGGSYSPKATFYADTVTRHSAPAGFNFTPGRDPFSGWGGRVQTAFASNAFMSDHVYQVYGKLRLSISFAPPVAGGGPNNSLRMQVGGDTSAAFETFSNSTTPLNKYYLTFNDFQVEWQPSEDWVAGWNSGSKAAPTLKVEWNSTASGSNPGAVRFDSLGLTYYQKQPLYLNYASVDAGAIVSDIFDIVNTSAPLDISIGTVETTTPRIRAYKRYDNIGRIIQELSDVESGFDWTIDPLTKQFNIHAKYGVTQSDVAFGFQAGANNLRTARRSTDSSVLANYVVVAGKYGLFYDTDVASASFYGVLEDYITLSEVADPSIISAMANVEVALRSQPRELYDFNPYPPNQTFQVPRLYKDYWIGDTVYFSAQHGRLQVDRQAVRIFELEFELDKSGLENIRSITTTAD